MGRTALKALGEKGNSASPVSFLTLAGRMNQNNYLKKAKGKSRKKEKKEHKKKKKKGPNNQLSMS